MKFSIILLCISALKTVNSVPSGEPSIFDLSDENSVADRDDEIFPGNNHTEIFESPVEAECTELGIFSSNDNQDNGNSTEAPDLPFPGLLKIGYGGHWKKGIQHWVAFPMHGLAACKQFVDLGRMGVGPKNGACQKSFKIANKWFQFDACHPTTGMPKYLLDEQGITIASCAAKKFEVLCLKQGKIWGRGSCEGPPPDELASSRGAEDDTGGHD